MPSDSPTGAAPEPNPLQVMRTRQYVVLLVLVTILGVPISAAAYFFLRFITRSQTWAFVNLPQAVGLSHNNQAPAWWPIPVLVTAGILVALTIQYLPGRGGHSPADGFKPHPPPTPRELPGVLIAAFVSLALGAVVGPEAPLIALGGGLAVLALLAAKRDSPAQTMALVGSAGAFAAVAFLLGSPILGAFLLMEASGLAGPKQTLVLLPGLLCAGIGFLVAIGLDNLTGFGTASLALPALPTFVHPTGAQFLWALAIGAVAAPLGLGIRRAALEARPHVEGRLLLLAPAVGLLIAAMAILYSQVTGHSINDVLFSGQDDMPNLVSNAANYTIGALLLLILCKSIAYSAALSTFRGGPTFPAMFIGAAGGILLSHAFSVPLAPAVAMGIGAMTVVMLDLPLTSVLLATILLGSDGVAAMPLVIVSVVVAFVVSKFITPPPPDPSPEADPTGSEAPATEPSPVPA